jgi:peptidase E
MDEAVLALSPPGQVAVLAGAARIGADYDGASARARRHYTALGATVTTVPDPRTDPDGALRVLDGDVGIVVLPGGSPASLLAVLVGDTPTPVGQRIVELHRSGVTLSGASAGAMVLCTRTFVPDAGDPGPTIADGLGLVHGLALPHWSPGASRWPVPDGVELWGLPECGGVVVTSDGVRAIGAGEPSRGSAGSDWTPLPRVT